MCSQSFGFKERHLLERSYEDYLECSDSVIVKGRLRINVNFWESIDASQFVLSVFKEDYKIPFYYTPTPVYLQNNKSSLPNSDFVFSAISELLKVGSVVECPFPPLVINPLSVSIQPNGKKRLILDLRHVNFCCCCCFWPYLIQENGAFQNIDVDVFVRPKWKRCFCSGGHKKLFWLVFF